MIFLNPAMGLTALAAGTGLTLLWYFLKLRRRPLRVSSTMLWARAARDLEVNAPIRWIRPSWLLLLQLLAVALLAGAVGRPAMEGARSAPGRWVLVIDRSASMRASDGANGRTRFEEAIDRAETIIRRLGAGERAMVASFAGSATLDAAMTQDRGVLLAALGGIEPTDQPAMIATAIELVAAQLGDDAAGARVVFLSDGGFRMPEETAPLGEADVRFMRTGPEASVPSMNTGIVACSARRDPDDPAALRVFVRVAHAGSAPREAVVSVLVDDTLVGAETLTVDPGGDASAVFETRRLDSGVLRARIAGTDALMTDDEAWVVIPAAQTPGAVVVSTDGVPGDPFLIRALEVATRQPVTRLTLGEWKLGQAPPSSFVVFDRCEPEREPAESTLHLGAGAPFAGVRLVRYESSSARSVLAWDRAHPAMRYLSLDSVLISGAPVLLVDEQVDAQALAVSDDGPIGVALTGGAARRLVFAFGPDGSNWETDPSFALFLALASEWLSPSTTGEGISHTTSEGIALKAISGIERVRVTGPESREAQIQADGFARLGALPIAGVYAVEGAEVRALAVNLFDEIESAIATSDSVALAGQGVASAGVDAVSVRELWRWFVLTGLVLASAEWFIYTMKMRV